MHGKLTLFDIVIFTVGDYLASQDHLYFRMTCRGTNTYYALRAFPMHSLTLPATMPHACFMLLDRSRHRSKHGSHDFLPATEFAPLGQAGVVRLIAL